MKVSIALSLLFLSGMPLLSACTPTQEIAGSNSAPDFAGDFDGVTDYRHFWLRAYELGSYDSGVDYAWKPLPFKLCIVDKVHAGDPPELIAAVDAFLANKTAENHKAVMAINDGIRRKYKAAHGELPGNAAKRVCEAG